MSHDQDGRGPQQVHSWTCDVQNCTETYEGDPGEEFVEAWAEARKLGWRSFRDVVVPDGEWQHRCPRHVGA